MTQHQFCKIYDKLNNQPHIQQIIKIHYYLSINKQQQKQNHIEVLQKLNAMKYIYNSIYGFDSNYTFLRKKITFAYDIFTNQNQKTIMKSNPTKYKKPKIKYYFIK
tara:strand:- start:491 stop:808 length:318 start_codon:yes stop_codon:yes gene_type:complete